MIGKEMRSDRLRHSVSLCLGTCALLLAFGLTAAAARPGQQGELLGPEESETLTSWTGRWLEGPVLYIASENEKAFYESLETTQERLQFIRLFWERRDPQIRGPVNEFLEEFEKRVAYANENFGNGEPGWKTVFGRVVLVLGPPARTHRTSLGSSSSFSERPPIVWSFDRKIPEWPPNENLIFVFRIGRWRLLPHTEVPERGTAREAQREWEATSTLPRTVIPTDFLRVEKLVIEETLQRPANYRSAIAQVRAEVAFPEAETPFGWEAVFSPGSSGDTRIELRLSLRMESLIFHPVDDTYRAQMLMSATLLDDDGEPVANATESIGMDVPADQLQSRADEIVNQTITLEAPAGSYALQFVLEDPVLGYRQTYRATVEVPG